MQMYFQFISSVAVRYPEAHAKATVLTMVDMDTGYVGVLMLSGKTPDNFMVRSAASSGSASLEPINRAEQLSVGGVRCVSSGSREGFVRTRSELSYSCALLRKQSLLISNLPYGCAWSFAVC